MDLGSTINHRACELLQYIHKVPSPTITVLLNKREILRNRGNGDCASIPAHCIADCAKLLIAITFDPTCRCTKEALVGLV